MNTREHILKNKFIRNRKSFIFLLILFLGIGFAYLSTQLNINGTTNVLGSKWSVYFDNITVNEGSVESDLPTIDTNKTTVDFEVTLTSPGDYYEFTVDAVNNGTIDAMIESISMTELTADVLKFLNYKVTYEDGTTIEENDLLRASKTRKFKVLVSFKKDVEATDLSEEGVSLNLSYTVNYVQSTIKIQESPFIKMVKSSAIRDSSIDFSQISSDTNGKGLYLRDGTENDAYPIYYYRGEVDNNNALFAGYCWKIVRTTETGGTKLIYNGLPDGTGQCTNTTGETTQLSTTSAFNENANSLAYVGYMYGAVYEYASKDTSTNDLFGNSFTYSNGVYTLNDTQTGIDYTHHYTCFNETGICSELAYVYNYMEFMSNIYDLNYITLNNGKSVEDALAEMRTNTNSSTMKTTLETWFNDTFKIYFTSLSKNYNDYLEDTVWCDDRSYRYDNTNFAFSNSGWNPNGGTEWPLYFGSTASLYSASREPTVKCAQKNDSFTVSDTVKGNGSLTYPIGLLTSDEIVLAGGQITENSTFYLNTNQYWWTMSPLMYNNISSSNYYIEGSGEITSHGGVDLNLGVRPSISIKSSVKIRDGGDGTSTAPYEFVVD